jgi:hypothetical protein
MAETYPISLALFDFVPTLAFLIGAFHLVKISLICRNKPNSRMAMAGTLLVFLGGFTKAFWKFMVAAEVANIMWLSQLQFILSGIGFLGMCVAVIYMVRGHTKMETGDVMLAMAPWKIPFLFIMTLSSLGAEGILAYMAFKRGLRGAGGAFAIGVMGLLAMGALASAEQTIVMQWIEEMVNFIGQSGFMMGSIMLHHDFKEKGCNI